ncbi:MAG: DNA polymerase I [Alphaproteobacteria bacterium]|nr:DNA polymerase I [Alphaproteobacteria bacterium]
MARMLLIDGSNHAFRAQFALPPRHASDGFPTRVLYGFTLLFQKMLRTWKPDYVAVAFDVGRNFREDIYPDYKGHRPEMPEDLRQQWPHLPELVEGFGYAVVSREGFEADDVLGTLAARFGSEDCEVFLVTSDKDFCQLVNDHVQVLDEAKGDTLDAFGVEDKFGVPPERIVDMLALAGDKSDNVPGVQGVGVKTAAKLLTEHGDLDGVLAAAARGDIKGKTGQRLVDEADLARLSKRLVTIATDIDLGLELDDLAPKGLDEDRLRELFDRWEFGLVMRKLLPDQETVDVSRFTAAGTPQAVDAALAGLRKGDLTSVQLSTGEDGAPVGLALGGTEGGGVWIPWTDEVAPRLLAVLADPAVAKVGFDTKALDHALHALGSRLEGVTGDVLLLDYLLAPHRRTHGLEDQAARHLAHTLGQAKAAAAVDGDPVAAEAAEIANVTAVLAERLTPKLEEGQARVYTQIELPLVPVLARMERTGIRLDTEAIGGVADDLRGRLEEVEAECHRLAGKPFNVRSRHELRDVLFTDLGLQPSKKVKDGWSTASDVLEKLVDAHPLPEKVLEYRSLDKLIGTYLSKLPDYVAADGRIHTSFNQAVAATGRLSSNDPNLQNIPVRTFEGRRIRACFVPEEGHVFLSADYSQIELRVLAHVTRDPVLLDGFTKGMDIHQRTAVEVFGLDPAEVTQEHRAAAKAINFGLLYGMSAFRLSRDLQIPREQAQAWMDAYFDRMPSVRGWIEATKEACRAQGHVDTLYGRRRVIPEIHSQVFTERAQGEREAVNTVIQGTAADLIKLAMLAVDRALTASGVTARLVLQVHDELLLEVPEAEVEQVRALVAREMEGVAELAVPLVVTTAIGRDWNEAHG